MSLYYASLQTLPLNSWGCFTGQRRLSDSPYVESVWEGTASHDGVHLTAADGVLDLTVRKRQGSTRMLLSGPTSRVCPTSFKAGDEVVAIRLRAGVHLPFTTSAQVTDVNRNLPNAGRHRFWLDSTAVAFPDFDNVEMFIGRLVEAGLLQRDIVVEDMLARRPGRTSVRTIQRHFIATTGLTMNHVQQIKRAERARGLLGSDRTLTAIAYESGYSNPGHMTNAFKYFFGRTPSSLRRLMTT